MQDIVIPHDFNQWNNLNFQQQSTSASDDSREGFVQVTDKVRQLLISPLLSSTPINHSPPFTLFNRVVCHVGQGLVPQSQSQSHTSHPQLGEPGIIGIDKPGRDPGMHGRTATRGSTDSLTDIQTLQKVRCDRLAQGCLRSVCTSPLLWVKSNLLTLLYYYLTLAARIEENSVSTIRESHCKLSSLVEKKYPSSSGTPPTGHVILSELTICLLLFQSYEKINRCTSRSCLIKI